MPGFITRIWNSFLASLYACHKSHLGHAIAQAVSRQLPTAASAGSNPYQVMWDLWWWCLYMYSCCSHLEHRASVKRFISLQLLDFRQSVGLLGRGISPSEGRYLHRTTQTQNKRRRTPMTWVGFEPMIPAFERANAFHALDRADSVLANVYIWVYFVSDHIKHFYILVQCLLLILISILMFLVT
jgi:hypothetical protein